MITNTAYDRQKQEQEHRAMDDLVKRLEPLRAKLLMCYTLATILEEMSEEFSQGIDDLTNDIHEYKDVYFRKEIKKVLKDAERAHNTYYRYIDKIERLVEAKEGVKTDMYESTIQLLRVHYGIIPDPVRLERNRRRRERYRENKLKKL